MEKLEAVFFDLDGTLVNTLSDIANAYNLALEKFGLPVFTENEYKKFIGNGSRILSQRLCGKENAHLVEGVNSLAIENYMSECTNLSEVYMGVQDAIEVLHSRGIKLAVLSNKPNVLVQEIIDAYFSSEMFSQIRGLESNEEPKPSIDVLIQLCKNMDVDPKNCIFVGDSDVDILTAQNANMKSAGVDWGYRSVEELENAGADLILEDTADIASLPEIFENID